MHQVPEAIERFACFGGDCTVLVMGPGPAGSAAEAAARARRRMERWHVQFSRFEPASELSVLNADPRETVAVSAMLARFVQAALDAAELTGGLVDPTLVAAIERAGYRTHFEGPALDLDQALALAPPRRPGAPAAAAHWREVTVDRAAGTVTRPPGVRLDSGGIGKGLFGDILAGPLEGHDSYAVDACGDVRFGGLAGVVRPIQVASPFGPGLLHVFDLTHGAAATSGIGRRSWLDRDGRPAHHLLDPSTGLPAFTGIVAVTALAPTALEAEARAKAALLSGPVEGEGWLAYGGIVVYDDASKKVVDPPPA
jgi:FAD:protein FMN transferase